MRMSAKLLYSDPDLSRLTPLRLVYPKYSLDSHSYEHRGLILKD